MVMNVQAARDRQRLDLYSQMKAYTDRFRQHIEELCAQGTLLQSWSDHMVIRPTDEKQYYKWTI